MKTNEFIKEVEAMGFNTIIQDCTILIETLKGEILGYVSSCKMFVFEICYTDFYNLTSSQQQLLFEKLSKYTSTPLNEREGEKKYRYYQKSIDGMEVVAKRECWNFNECNNHWFLDSEFEIGSIKTSFTHSWLKERGIDIKQLQEKYEEVEAKE